MDSSDEALLQAVADGDRAALQVLYERHAPWLTLRLSRRCADPDLVDDVEEPHEADATPTTRARRRLMLAALCLPVLALAWLALLQLAGGATVLVTTQLAALVAVAAVEKRTTAPTSTP